MRKTFLILLLLVMVVLVSCSQDTVMENKLVGTWKRTSGTYSYYLVLASDRWAEISTWNNGTRTYRALAKWSVDGRMLVFKSGTTEEYVPFSLKNNNTLLFDGLEYNRI